jgi:type II secretory ATPase GspE/PulE/Tfp pilus assembly ATPase PilB-like protein
MGVEPFLISSSVVLVGAQRLVRKICQNCKKSYEPDKATISKLGIKDTGKKIVFYRGKGCKFCLNTGYKGRVGIIEALVLTPKIKDLITNKEHEHVIKEEARKESMNTLRENGMKKVMAGVTTVEEILRVTIGDQELEI